MICQFEGCKKQSGKGIQFFCKPHWAKVPSVLKVALKKEYKKNDHAITVTAENEFILRANYAIKMPDTWEKRSKFALQKLREKKDKRKIIIVNGMSCGPRNYTSEHWKIFDKVKASILPKGKSIYTTIFHGDQLIQFFKDFPPAAVILLGTSGVHAMIDDRTVNDDGWIRGGRKIMTLAEVQKAKFDARPTTPAMSYNRYYHAPTMYLDVHPDEYQEIGDDEVHQIKRCLTWAKQFLKVSEK